MRMKQYPEEKRQILAERNVDDVADFFQEIKGQVAQSLYQIIPRPKGFRTKGQLRPEAQRSILKRFISSCKKEKEISNSCSVVWKQFADIFVLWVKSRSELFKVLEGFSNEEDFNEDNEHIDSPNSELDYQCFNILLEASHNSRIDRETIQRFYDYGYFNEDKKIQTIIDKAVPYEGIKRKQKIAELPDRVEELSQIVNTLISRVSAMESSNEANQDLDQRIAEAIAPFESRLIESKASFRKSSHQLKQAIYSQLSKVEDSVKSLETQLAEGEFVDSTRQEIGQLIQCIQESNQSHGDRFDGLDKRIAEIKTERDKQSQLTKAPRLAYQAVCIGDRFDSQLSEDNEHYSDEDDYLWNFTHCLRRFGVTNSGEIGDEMAAAIHVALKTFPALAFNDTRVFRVWQLMCGNHCHITEIGVEMGWLGLQDWFPELFSHECFGEKLRRIDLEISIRRMLEIGDMPWAIHFSNCDRSFPESYLPRFLDWIGELSDGEIRIFLTSCSGMNRCRTTQDAYARVACLPAPERPEPIEARNLQPGDIVTRHEWKSWCQPNHTTHQVEFLNQLQEAIENTGVQIPIVLLREIQRYLGLSHGLLAPSRALDWALTLRLLPWIAYHREAIDAMQNLMNQENRELPHFQKELLQAREESE